MWSPAAGHFHLGSALIGIRIGGFGHPALVGRDRRYLDDPSGWRPVPAPAWAYAGSGRLPTVIVPRRLEVQRVRQNREALPHGHSVADWPLLRPTRRLSQPGLHAGSGRGARAHSLYSFKRGRVGIDASHCHAVDRKTGNRPAGSHQLPASIGTSGAPVPERSLGSLRGRGYRSGIRAVSTTRRSPDAPPWRSRGRRRSPVPARGAPGLGRRHPARCGHGASDPTTCSSRPRRSASRHGH